MSPDREFDVIVWGATGFTGRLVAEYLVDRYGVDDDLRWAIGGRNPDKLAEVRDDLGPAAAALELVVGDASRPVDLRTLAERTKVVCTTVGPYAEYGSELVAACVAAGTDYCDLTGEVHWMRAMIDLHAGAAVESGARIVHACGFDCIPSDMGTWFLQQQMQERHGAPSPRVRMGVAGFSGSVSGGTVASMLAMMETGRDDPGVQQVLDDPYGLNPEGERYGPDDPDPVRAEHDPVFGQWTGPFVMAVVDTKVVRRTNALLDHAYGRDFRYGECMLVGAGPVGRAKATALAGALGGGMAAIQLGPLRSLLGRVAPEPGEGPSKATREKGFFELRFWGSVPGDTDDVLEVRVEGDRDPGYGSTSKMLGESAVALAFDDLDVGGGFWTPAAALAPSLADRLPENAGVTFSVV